MWTLNCQKCDKKTDYCSQNSYTRALRGKGLCNGCSRAGQRRTEEQCRKISNATKIAMNNPIIRKNFMASYTEENKQKRSDSTKRQMEILFSNKELWEKYLTKQRISRKTWWTNADNSIKDKILNSAWKGSGELWKDDNYRKMMSEKMMGNKNPFYGKHHSPETIERLRKATTDNLIKFWKSGRLMGINTKPELKMQKLLRDNGIHFETPFRLKHKIYDLYLPKYNILIEVDGCYWHSKNVPLSEMNKQQLRRWKNDRYKDSLAQKNGYKLLRVWEDEIEQFNIYKELIINE